MKIAISGKGGVGKTSLTAWLGDYLARRGEKVWLVDADTALSLGQASGLERAALPEPLTGRAALIEERIRPAGKGGMMDLDPQVSDLPEALSASLPLAGPDDAEQGKKRLLVMGPLTNAGGGCACESNALLKALLAHLEQMRPKKLVGVGKWAQQQGQALVDKHGLNMEVLSIPHPSPANPAANRGWGNELGALL